MIVTVDLSSPVPVFEQIREQISALILLGSLSTGDRLPPIRQLASDLDLSPGTVARAYAALEASGVIETRRGLGTRVAATSVTEARRVSDEELNSATDQFIALATEAGLSYRDMIALIRARHR